MQAGKPKDPDVKTEQPQGNGQPGLLLVVSNDAHISFPDYTHLIAGRHFVYLEGLKFAKKLLVVLAADRNSAYMFIQTPDGLTIYNTGAGTYVRSGGRLRADKIREWAMTSTTQDVFFDRIANGRSHFYPRIAEAKELLLRLPTLHAVGKMFWNALKTSEQKAAFADAFQDTARSMLRQMGVVYKAKPQNAPYVGRRAMIAKLRLAQRVEHEKLGAQGKVAPV